MFARVTRLPSTSMEPCRDIINRRCKILLFLVDFSQVSRHKLLTEYFLQLNILNRMFFMTSVDPC